MPELPEVEAGRKLAAGAGAGHRVVRVETVDDDIVYDGTTPEAVQRCLRGRTILDTHRHGKHIWFELDRRPWPCFHFGMTGALVGYRDQTERPRVWKIEITYDHGVRLAMTNSRRLGRVRLRNDPRAEAPISTLGFDPYLEMPSPTVFVETLRSRKAIVKGLLLDQSFAAGVGNWIADEVLFQAGIDPRRPANTLSVQEAKTLRAKLASVLKKAVAVDADAGRFPRSWMFHRRWGKRDGQKTARGEAIEHITVAGRTTAWVPSRQR